MGIAAIQSGARSTVPAAQTSGQVSSDRALTTLRALGRPMDPSDPAVIRQTASQMVSEMVYVPLLAEMREFPFGREIGNGGRGEAVFAQQLDQRVADAVASSQGSGLVDQLVRRLDGSAAASAKAATATMRPMQVSWLTREQASAVPGGKTP